MGLIVAGAVAALAWFALWRTRGLNPASLQLLGAALLTGLAGYALQGRTGLLGSPAAERGARALPPAMPIPLTEEFFGRFTEATSWIVIANSFMARGNSGEAVATLGSATRARPRNMQLWLAYANAIRIHGGGRISPAARLAFEQSARSSPHHSAPAFFFGLALAQSGDVAGALVVWKQSLAKAPPDSAWAASLTPRIAILERLGADNSPSPADRPRVESGPVSASPMPTTLVAPGTSAN